MNAPETAAVRVAFTELPDLAAERYGGKVLAANDDFFAPKENLLKPGRGVFIADKFTPRGKWMDGWETRRKRVPGHDWALLRLGMPGRVVGVDVDTNHFVGNFPEYCALEACSAPASASPRALEKARWRTILPKSRLAGGTRNLFPVADAGRSTHLRLRIFPGGGVARLRVHGEVLPDWKALPGLVDLAALENGGQVLAANDMFFGPKDNLIQPGRAKTMGDGWETRRKRAPGHDWIVVQLGRAGRIERIEVDTNHFKGNFPESCSIVACRLDGPVEPDFHKDHAVRWHGLLGRTPLRASARHYFRPASREAFTHVKLNIFPDGGISRLRLWGRAR
ncbi:MAG TPA: allantoicase [Elusimicrobiota bacterium]|nr:allantoicase [Elusimicrobiota bacterium]